MLIFIFMLGVSVEQTILSEFVLQNKPEWSNVGIYSHDIIGEIPI
jgi:hypothetical protein